MWLTRVSSIVSTIVSLVIRFGILQRSRRVYRAVTNGHNRSRMRLNSPVCMSTVQARCIWSEEFCFCRIRHSIPDEFDAKSEPQRLFVACILDTSATLQNSSEQSRCACFLRWGFGRSRSRRSYLWARRIQEARVCAVWKTYGRLVSGLYGKV